MVALKHGGAKLLAQYFIVVFLLMLVFRSMFTASFAFHNDYFMLTDEFSCCMEHPETKHLIRIGRPLGALLLNLQSLFLDSIRDAAMNRMVALLTSAASLFMFAVYLRRIGAGWLLALGISFGVFLLPGNQLNVIWISNFVPGVINILLTLAAAFFIERVDPAKLVAWRDRDAHALKNLGLCFLTLILTLLIYPPTTMFFLVPTLALVLFSPLEVWRETRLKVLRNLIVLGVAVGSYYTVAKIVLSIKYPDYQLGSYQFKMSGLSAEKLSYFFHDISYLTLNLWNTPPSRAVLLSVCVLIACGVISLVARMLFSQPRRMFELIQMLGIICLLLVISSLPNLAASASLLGYRMFVTYSAMAALLVFWAALSVGYLLPWPHGRRISTILAGVILAKAAFLASANVTNAAINASLELDFVRSEIEEQVSEDESEVLIIFVARPVGHATFTDRPLAYDFRFMATNYSLIGNVFQLALKEIGDNRRVRVIPADSTALEKLRGKPSRHVILVDMNRLVSANAKEQLPPYGPSILTGQPESVWDTEAPSFLHSYKGTKIFYAGGVFYSIPESERQFSVQRFLDRSYEEAWSAESYESIISAIAAASPSRGPVLIEQGFRNFDVIFLKGRYYGIPIHDFKAFVVAASAQEVKDAIRQCYSLAKEPCVIWSGNPIVSRNK